MISLSENFKLFYILLALICVFGITGCKRCVKYTTRHCFGHMECKMYGPDMTCLSYGVSPPHDVPVCLEYENEK